MGKQKAKIEHWELIRTHHTHGDFVLVGKIRFHPRQKEFKSMIQQTSRLLSIDFEKREATTLNTIYELV